MNNAKSKRKLWHILRLTAIDPGAVTLHEWGKAHTASLAIGRRDFAGMGIVEIRFAHGMRLPIGPGVMKLRRVNRALADLGGKV